MREPVEVRLTAPGKLEREQFITPPDWAVRAVSVNRGKKCTKYPQTWVRGFQNMRTYPGDADDYAAWGFSGEPRDYDTDWQRQQREREERANTTVVRGNLKEEQYRFWNGSPMPNAEVATCRWCRHWCYGAAKMREHQHNTQHTLLLRAVYDYARSRKFALCFTCGAKTGGEKWGIPLCAKNKCLNTWRVGAIVDVSSTLLLYAKMAFKHGILDDWLNGDRSEKYNVETNPKQFNWDNARAY